MVSSSLEAPQKNIFSLFCTIKNHNLVKGNYQIRFNIGIKDISLGVRNFDVLRNVLSFSIEYLKKTDKNSYSLWLPNWGDHLLSDYSLKLDASE